MKLYLRTLVATELQKPLLHVSPGNTHPGTRRAYLPRFFPQLLPRRPHFLPLLSQAREGVSSSRLLHVVWRKSTASTMPPCKVQVPTDVSLKWMSRRL